MYYKNPYYRVVISNLELFFQNFVGNIIDRIQIWEKATLQHFVNDKRVLFLRLLFFVSAVTYIHSSSSALCRQWLYFFFFSFSFGGGFPLIGLLSIRWCFVSYNFRGPCLPHATYSCQPYSKQDLFFWQGHQLFYSGHTCSLRYNFPSLFTLTI